MSTIPTSRQRAAAERRARRLLLSYLTPKQRRDLKTKGYFKVVGNATKRTYRIERGGRGPITPNRRNIFDPAAGCAYGYAFLDIGHEAVMVRGEIVGFRYLYPAPSDALLAQKLAIETDERKFLGVACRVSRNR